MLMAPAALLAVVIPYDLIKVIKRNSKDSLYLPWAILFPTASFVALYSMLPHKELRFIFPSVAGFNICIAFVVSRLWQDRKQFGSSSKHRWIKKIAEVRKSPPIY
jgi:hypothetical protein